MRPASRKQIWNYFVEPFRVYSKPNSLKWGLGQDECAITGFTYVQIYQGNRGRWPSAFYPGVKSTLSHRLVLQCRSHRLSQKRSSLLGGGWQAAAGSGRQLAQRHVNLCRTRCRPSSLKGAAWSISTLNWVQSAARVAGVMWTHRRMTKGLPQCLLGHLYGF